MGLILFAGLPASAQDGYPKTELFLGYSFNIDAAGRIDRTNSHGWSANMSRNFNRYFGITTDFGGGYGNAEELLLNVAGTLVPVPGTGSFGAYRFMAGPRITARGKRLTWFIHVLFGAAVSSVSSFTLPDGTVVPTDTEIDFAMGYGTGFDVHLVSFLGWRLIQFDHIPVRVEGTWVRNNRVQTGFVFKW